MSCRDLPRCENAALEALHASQGWPYDFPDLEAPEFVSKRALYDENGAFVGCVVARKTVELYFIGNPSWRTPKWRLEALKMLHRDVERELRVLGYSDGHVWLPPQVDNFARRLQRMGWQLNEWRCLSRKVN